MRRIKKEELDQVARSMVEIFFDELEISTVTKGIDPDKAKEIMYENLYCDMEYFYRYGDVFVSDDDISGIVTLIDGKKFSIIKKTILSLKSSRKIAKIATKEEIKTLNTNAKKFQGVHSFNWFKKRKNVPFYLAHIGVAEKKRGQGICRQMLEFVFDYTKQYNNEIVLETFTTENVSIYQHFGFEVVETVEAKDKMLKEYRMIKKL